MHIQVTLHSYLKELLPSEVDGKTTLELSTGSTLRQMADVLHIPEQAAFAVNEQIEHDLDRELLDGDSVRVFRPGAGG